MYFPFNMGGMGGSGFGGFEGEEEGESQGRRPRREQSETEAKDPEHTRLYEVLGVPKTSTDAEIKKAFRKLAMTHHPDKGGDPEKFKEITKAYEILSNKDKRKLYDDEGEEAAERGDSKSSGGGGSDVDDILGEMFGFRRGGGGRSGPRKGEDCVFQLKVDLSDLYTGAVKKLKLTRNILCAECKGAGGKDEKRCVRCQGRGMRTVLRPLGPGMYSQMQMTCDECKGQGKIIADENKCKACNGMKTTKEQKTLEVTIDKGMMHGQRITFKGEADEAPDTTPGDVVVVLQQKEHAMFHREGMNLFMKKKLTLVEALTGYQFRVPHLDGRVLLVKSEEGNVVKPGDFKAVRDEGMPKHKQSHRKGDLFIEFDVEFPTASTLSKVQKEALRKLLPGPISSASAPSTASSAAPASSSSSSASARGESKAREGEEGDQKAMAATSETIEEVTMVDVDMEVEKKRFLEQRREAYEEEEGDDDNPRRGGGAHTTTCRAQ